MSLLYQCPNCGEQFPAEIRLKGLYVAGQYMKDEKEVCENCTRIADEAKAEALKKRKKI